MPSRPAFSLAAALAVLLAGTRPAGATLVVPLDLDALTDRADDIALARVESQVGRFTSDRSAIYTEVTLVVVEAVKGSVRAGERVVVRREGGEAEGLGMRVVGAPRFADGEDVLVFLERRSGKRGQAETAAAAPRWTVGMAQGKLHVAERAGRRTVVRDRSGLAFLGEPPAEPAVEPLDEVLVRIHARMKVRP